MLVMDRAHLGLTRKYVMADNTDGKKIIDKIIKDTRKEAYDNIIP